MFGVIFSLFKLAWYLLWLPAHVLMVVVAGIISCALMVVDIPLWVLVGRYGILSDKTITWFEYHEGKVFGD